MKTLKNLVATGIIGASLFFGEKNLSAQETDSLSRNNIKINFECYEADNDNHKKILPCFNDDKIPKEIEVKLNKENLKVEMRYNFYHVEKRGDIANFENCKGDILLITLLNRNAKVGVDEFFYICYETGIIKYIRIAHKGRELAPMINQEALTKQDIYEKFGEGFANRTKEIINARGDSLKMTNLIKKEYEMGKLINENGEIEKVVHQFY